MNSKRLKNFLRVGMQLGIMLAISTLYTNCGGFSSGGGGSSASSSTSLSSTSSSYSCDDATLTGIYQSGYYGFIRSHNCALCHGTGGTGPAIGADNINQAYSIFKVGTGQWVNETLNANAVDPNHHGAGTPTNQSAITALSTAWNAAIGANCKVATVATSTLAYTYSLSAKTVSLAPGASVELTWDLSKALIPASSIAASGTTLTMTITASPTGAVQAGYSVSKPLITSTTKGIKVSGAKVLVNGKLYKLGTTFVNSIADIPSGVDSFPLSRGSIFIAMPQTSGDSFALQIGDIGAPTIENNYVMPAATGTVTFSNIAKFSELVQPGGPFAVNCVQCHNPVFKNGSLNILDYTSVMQFVTPGLYSSHGDPESAMISLIQGNDANVMPPKGQVPYYVPFTTPFISWFNAGALNN